MSLQLRTTCNRDCPDSCSIIATVEGGRIVAQHGAQDHGITQGFLCQRGNRYLERFYSPDRVLHPQRRLGGAWQQISWDDALDVAAEQLWRQRAELGPEAVAFISYSGIKGLVAKAVGRLFWDQFGGPTLTGGGTSVEATHAAQALSFGGEGTHAPQDLVNSRALVVWGKNIATTRPHIMPFLRRARRQGAPLHVIDPVLCATARQADQFHQLRPGSDAFLALAVARLLIEWDAYDHAFVAAHTRGFAQYRKLVFAHTLAAAAQRTDLPPQQIEQLARIYAEHKPVATLHGLGASYWRQGGATVRLIDALVALSGNIGIAGGGSHTDTSAHQGMQRSLVTNRSAGARRVLLLPRLGQDLLDAEDPPIRMAWVAGANPAATSPHTARVDEALRSLDFLVVVDQFLTASCSHADLFLPCTSYLEMEDLVSAYGHHWLGMTQAVVPPLGEARSDVEIYQGLAARLGFGPELEGTPREWARQILGELGAHGITPKSLLEAPCSNPLTPPIAFTDFRFGTESRCFEFIRELDVKAPTLGPEELHLVATKTLKMCNAQINEREIVAEPRIRVHPETLLALGLEEGEWAWIESPVGGVAARVAGDGRVRRDVVLFNPAAWRGDLQGVNQLRQSIMTDMGDAAAMHETRVRLRPYAGSPCGS